MKPPMDDEWHWAVLYNSQMVKIAATGVNGKPPIVRLVQPTSDEDWQRHVREFHLTKAQGPEHELIYEEISNG